MKVEITKAQMQAIADLTSDIESMIGCSDTEFSVDGGENTDVIWERKVKLIDRFFINNGYKR